MELGAEDVGVDIDAGGKSCCGTRSRAGLRKVNVNDGGSCSAVANEGAGARRRTMGDKLVDNGCCTEI